MFADVDPDGADAGELRRRYADALGAAIDEAGAGRAREAAGDAAVGAIRDGDVADLELGEAAAVLALRGDRDADSLVAEARDTLMLAMTGAMVDVEVVATEVDADLDPKEVQAKVEGRLPMTVGEYAAFRAFLAGRQ